MMTGSRHTTRPGAGDTGAGRRGSVARMADPRREMRMGLGLGALGIMALLALTGPARAETEQCGDLGIESAYLERYFCQQLEDLAQGGTRSILGGDSNAPAMLEQFANIGIIQDAYRADPKKTLALIDRIKGAGGLTEQ